MSDDNLETLYELYLGITDKMVERFGAMQVAAVMMTQALSIYKTAMDEDEYNSMVDAISHNRDKIKTFSVDKTVAH